MTYFYLFCCKPSLTPEVLWWTGDFRK